ncbi:MAG: sugar O-acetyltransferase [Desulfovibrio sp.]|nr:sugar O-acetyltransferase [Desulfovibrio sp.]
MTEREKMIAGMVYDPMDAELVAGRKNARRLCWRLSQTSPENEEEIARIVAELLPNVKTAYITPPFFCDYGYNIYCDDWFYCNAGCVFLDCAPVRVGVGTLFGPNAQVYTAAHPLNPKRRRDGEEFAKPIAIGANVWIGGSAILCPSVKIGENSVIGAGSVVVRDIPANVLAVGNPCHPFKSVDGED